MKKEIVFKSTLKQEIKDFLELRESQGHDIRKERYILITLDQYLDSCAYVNKNLNAETTEGWLASLPHEMSVNTKIVYISHYAQFAKFLTSLGYQAFVPERPVDNRHYVPYIFTREELDKLVMAADETFTVINRNGRHGAVCFSIILRMLIGCGFRLNEVLLLNTNDINLDNAVILIKSAKGNKDRLVPMHQTLTAVLKSYIDSNIPEPQGLLFPNKNGKPFSQTWARNRFNCTLKAAGIEKPTLKKYERNICIHCLRHTFAVASFREQQTAGRDMYDEAPVLSTYMGHEGIYGTEKYLHMTTENSDDILRCMEQFNEGLFPEVNA